MLFTKLCLGPTDALGCSYVTVAAKAVRVTVATVYVAADPTDKRVRMSVFCCARYSIFNLVTCRRSGLATNGVRCHNGLNKYTHCLTLINIYYDFK